MAEDLSKTLHAYVRKGYTIKAFLGAEGSPTCGVARVGRWKKDAQGKKVFPKDVEFISGTGVFVEEFQAALQKYGISPEWIGIPGKSIRCFEPESFEKTLQKIESIL